MSRIAHSRIPSGRARLASSTSRALLMLVLVLACLGTAACDRTPTSSTPALKVPSGPSYTETSSVQIDPSTHVQWVEGRTQMVRFTDTDGNWYRMEADYDDQNRMTEYRSYFNGEFVGKVNPTSQGAGQTQFVAAAATGDWVGTDETEQVTAVSWDWTACEDVRQLVCGGGEGGYVSEVEPCEDDYFVDCGIRVQVACADQYNELVWRSVGMVGGYLALGGGIVATGPAAPFALGAGVVAMATTTREWYRAMRAVEVCKQRNRPAAV